MSTFSNVESLLLVTVETEAALSPCGAGEHRAETATDSDHNPTNDNGDGAAFDPIDGEPLADNALVESERRAAVRRAVASLPVKYRVPVVLRDIEGSTYEEIAHVLDTSVGTIKSRISRARALLRHKLVGYL